MRATAKLAAAIAVVVTATASARADSTTQPCTKDIWAEGAGGCRLLTPAIVASSSLQPYGRFALVASSQSAAVTPFASQFGSTLTEYGLTATPQVGVRVAPFMLVYGGADVNVQAGGNIGTLVGEGAVASYDAFLGTVLKVAPWERGRPWRLALNGRLTHGAGEAIDLDRVALGITANFINSGLIDAIGQVAGGLKDIAQPYTLASGRLDLVGAYADDSSPVTVQLAIGGESTRQDFTPVATGDLQRVLTTAAPRFGAAIGFEPDAIAAKGTWWPFELLLEYEVTVKRSWLEVYGGGAPQSPPRVATNVIALGIYSPRRWNRTPQENFQIGVTPFYELGVPNDLITASQQNLTSQRSHVAGIVMSLHYLF